MLDGGGVWLGQVYLRGGTRQPRVRRSTAPCPPGPRARRYADLKARLREAGLPTGGKKRKILARLRGLDAKEAARTARKARPAGAARAEAAAAGEEGSSEVSSESVLDARFRAVYDDPDYQLDPTSEHFSLVKGRRCPGVKGRRRPRRIC